MKRRYGYAGLTCALSLSLLGCGAEEGPVKSGGADKRQAGQSAEPPAEPETAAEFLDLAEAAMAEEAGWAFGLEGEEGLTLQGQENAASFEATVRLSRSPDTLHSDGVVTADDGETTSEEVYVIGGTAYVKEAGAAWKQGPVAGAEMRNKVEDPVAALEQFQEYVKESGDAVSVTRSGGTVRLQVATGSRKLAGVQGVPYVAKALREFESTAQQLREAGIAVDEAELTVAGLEETLVLDARTHRIESHRFRFRLLLPYGSDEITYRQDVREENRGVFDGRIQLPAGVA